MINLLPYETKKQTRAARTNVALIRYIFLLGVAIVFLGLSCAVTYIFLINNKDITNTNIADSSTTKTTTSDKTQSASFQTNLANAKIILDRQVVYSGIITGIAAILPTGTALDSLSLSDSSFGTATNLKVFARSADSESKLKENFQKSPLFSDYKLISTSAKPVDIPGYTVTINISVTIKKGVAL